MTADTMTAEERDVLSAVYDILLALAAKRRARAAEPITAMTTEAKHG